MTHWHRRSRSRLSCLSSCIGRWSCAHPPYIRSRYTQAFLSMGLPPRSHLATIAICVPCMASAKRNHRDCMLRTCSLDALNSSAVDVAVNMFCRVYSSCSKGTVPSPLRIPRLRGSMYPTFLVNSHKCQSIFVACVGLLLYSSRLITCSQL